MARPHDADGNRRESGYRRGKRAAEELNKRDAYDVLIVGSCGAAAAVYSARKGIRTGLMGERFGGQVLDTVDIENYISVPKPKVRSWPVR